MLRTKFECDSIPAADLAKVEIEVVLRVATITKLSLRSATGGSLVEIGDTALKFDAALFFEPEFD